MGCRTEYIILNRWVCCLEIDIKVNYSESWHEQKSVEYPKPVNINQGHCHQYNGYIDWYLYRKYITCPATDRVAFFHGISPKIPKAIKLPL